MCHPPANEDSTDKTLIVRLAGGDKNAFDTLFVRHRVAVSRFLRRRLNGDEATSEDLTQECFLRLWQARHSLKPEGAKLKTLLLTIGRNLVLDYRKQRILPTQSLPAEDTAIKATLTSVRNDSPESTLLNRELRQVFETACRQLSDDLQEAFLLREEGISYVAIAEILGCPIGTVRSRMHAARTHIREETRKYLDDALPVRHVISGTEQKGKEIRTIYRESTLRPKNVPRIESVSGYLSIIQEKNDGKEY